MSGSKNKRPPEDKKKDESQPLTEDQDDSESIFSTRERWTRIVQNEMENVPITIALLVYSVSIQSTSNETNIAMGCIFLFGRIMQTVCYAYALQPWRSIGWSIGMIGTLGFMVNIVYGTYKE